MSRAAVAQLPVRSTRQGEFCLLQVAYPGRGVEPAGVLLLDPDRDELHLRLLSDWQGIPVEDEEEREVFEALEEDLRAKALEAGGAALLASLEETLSNVLRLSPRERIAVSDFPRTLRNLFREHVEGRPAAVRPFETHLPLFSLRAAATRFGEDMAVDEEGWVEAPDGLRLTPEMFVAHVVGRSMEPRIPDGSLCIFRANPAGSRQGKIVLVELLGESDSSARYTVKRYTSRKRQDADGEWQHESIRLEPLNREPQFSPIDLDPGQLRVVGEFVQVLE